MWFRKIANNRWYHVAPKNRLDDIRLYGLKLNSEPHLSQASLGDFGSLYPSWPVFLCLNPQEYMNPDNVLIQVNTQGLPLVADLPTMIDGRYGDGGFFESQDGFEVSFHNPEAIPAPLNQFAYEDGLDISVSDLLDPNSEMCQMAIRATGTCACLSDISVDRLQFTE